MCKRAFGIVVFLFCISASVAYAQEQAGFSVSPPSFEVNVNPGDTIKNTIKVENLSDQKLIIKSRPQNFTVYGQGGQVSLTDEDSSFSIASWINIEDNTLSIAPKQHAFFNFSITIPRSAEPGSHYGAVVFTTDNKSRPDAGEAAVNQEIGALILLKLPGKVNENARLISFIPTEKTFIEPKIGLNALIENTGNVHIKPYGYITIYNPFGGKVKSIEVRGRNILPGSKRVFDESFAFPNIGYYRAEINLVYAGGGGLLKSETWFMSLNKQMSMKYIIAAGILLIVYILFRKRINRAVTILLKG